MQARASSQPPIGPYDRLSHMQGSNLGSFKEKSFAERRTAAADTKKSQLEQFRAKLAGPDLQVRLAERQKVVEARHAREAERETARRAREAQEAAERAAREAAEAAARAEMEARLAEQRERERAEREASRPKQLIRELAMFAERKASGSRR